MKIGGIIKLSGWVLCALLYSATQASYVNLHDDAGWTQVGNTYYQEIDGVTVTLDPGSDKLTWYDDGIGIYGGEKDEIDGAEVLDITFSPTVHIQNIQVADLYVDGDGTIEQGVIKVGSETFNISAANSTNGDQTVGIGMDADKVSLFSKDDEFAVYGANFTASVPEPATWLLLGFAFAGMWLKKKRS